jgi:Pyruvate/2-oxoacid:ferredoxin oxidoreductase delta subunit
MSLPLWAVKLLQLNFPSRFFLAKLTKYPLIGKLLDYLFFHKDEIIYLPQNKVVQLNQKINVDKTSENLVLPTKIVEHFIDQAKYHWIMNFCFCRDADKCEDYPIELGCLFLGKAVLGINPKLGRLVSKQEALEHINKCQDTGLVHLIGRNKLDQMWLNVRPGNQLLTICNCCPCCCLWKMLPDLDVHISGKITKMPGVSIHVTNRCTGCGVCTNGICFVDAINVVDGHTKHSENCRGCGRCVSVCPHRAIEFNLGKDVNFIRESIDKISPLIDLK